MEKPSITTETVTALFDGVPGRRFTNQIMRDLTWYRTGGPVDLLIYPKHREACLDVVRICQRENIPFFVFGKGSNILISDEGYRGVFIALDDACDQMELSTDRSYVGAGVVLWELVQATMQAGLGDMSNMSWIPGTVGGALHMNAGAFGTEIEEFVRSVDLITPDGEFRTLKHSDCGFSYRKAAHLQGNLLLGAEMQFSQSSVDAMQSNSMSIIERRKSKQPLHRPSCGSVFKRPPGHYAGTLIEQCGLKGFRIGGAEVSKKHANFILNDDHARSDDIYQVIRHVQSTVFAETGVTLEREVKLIGFEGIEI